MEIPPAPYLPTSDSQVVESTPLSQSGWYEDGQHGGLVAGLLARALEAVPTLAPMEVARLTVDIFRVVPTVPLRVSTSILREGKRIQTVRAFLSAGDTELAQATAMRLRIADRPPPQRALPPPALLPLQVAEARPVDMKRVGVGVSGRPYFHRDGVEMRQAEGSFDHPGPGAVWIRMIVPLVAGEEPTPLQRAVITADHGNGVSSVLPTSWVFMNADLNVHLLHMPVGEWLGLRSESWFGSHGRGVAHSQLFDATGAIGRSVQSLFADYRTALPGTMAPPDFSQE
ncbi:MAG: thioesterase family protein [bacterium]|nr:thioesterase family protein [Acidimicrobiia bacterium]MCY4649113.1 thioesterase family protein [bacterium]